MFLARTERIDVDNSVAAVDTALGRVDVQVNPDGIAMLKALTTEQSEASKERLVEMVTQFASGRYDALSGRYLEPGDDFDALLAESG